ncbi:EamA domain-containing membrane protein RarD [Cupriavidus sp. YR651]|uniref:DMT family transporter n=1 Tax=Cupriavidus sp. YR651 TaxID=1855315 RepID=UPI00088769A3|nr:DMT family transporter [Cupriavidus sp. YR651]SDC03240.1 EamA domain-containing membrane protein RarD [Cupriavidus sp. YR651]
MSASNVAAQHVHADPHSVKSSLSILFGASVWGIAWFPYRVLNGWGLGGMSAAALVSCTAALISLIVFRRQLSGLRGSWLFAAIGLAAGVTNAGFVWGSVNGHVMRVLLLFYLTPVWTALFARMFLGERLSAAGLLLVALALFGAGLMLWTPEVGVPLPGNAAEWSGLAGGMGFAVNNVLSRRAGQRFPEMDARLRTVVVYVGCTVVGVPCALLLDGSHVVLARGAGVSVASLVLGLAVVLVVSNAIVQYGLQRLPANRVSLLMLFEIVVAAVSAWWLATETLSWKEAAGGLCIVAAGALSGLVHRAKPASTAAAPGVEAAA